MIAPRREPTSTTSRWARIALTVYWPLMWIATHWPYAWSSEPGLPHGDKLLHLSAYAALGTLLAFGWARSGASARGNAISVWRRGLLLVALVSAVGLLDEITQPWFGRRFDWFDWLADVSGAAGGVGLVFAAGRGEVACEETAAPAEPLAAPNS